MLLRVDAGNAGAPAPSGPTDVPTVPDAFKKAGARYIVVELTMAYKPISLPTSPGGSISAR